MSKRGERSTGGGRGFTLVELLVVIAIIGVLIAIGLVVGEQVTTSGQRTATQGKLIILDQSLAAYKADRGGANPPAFVRVSDPDITDPNEWDYMLLADAASFGQEGNISDPMPTMINSVGAYIKATESLPSVRSIVEDVSPPPEPFRAGGSAQPELPTVFDRFRAKFRVDTGTAVLASTSVEEQARERTNDNGNNPIRFVHPSFDGRITRGEDRQRGQPGAALELFNGQTGRYSFRGTQLPPVHGDSPYVGSFGTLYNGVFAIRRNYLNDQDRENWRGQSLPIGDGDGGKCPNGQPYFYSPGPDGDPSTHEDNVYTDVRPVLPAESTG